MPPEGDNSINAFWLCVDWTIVMSVLVVVVGGLVAFMQIFGSAHISEKKLRKSEYMNDMKNDIKKNTDGAEKIKKDITDLRQLITDIKNTAKNAEEYAGNLHEDNLQLLEKLDQVLTKVLDFFDK